MDVRTQEQERRTQQAQPPVGGVYGGDTDFSLFGGTLRNSDPDLFSIVIKAVGYFLK
jgi:hypothetical protein